MSYFDYQAKQMNMPAKVQPITTYKRESRSEFTANQQLRVVRS